MSIRGINIKRSKNLIGTFRIEPQHYPQHSSKQVQSQQGSA
jgi:hypothetical protein